jgi:hypothetical protein
MASVISPGTLSILQGIAEDAMLDTVEIFGPGVRVDLPSGGWEFDEGDTVVTRGMISPLSKESIERLVASRIDYLGLEQLKVPLDTAISGEDKVAVTSIRHGGTRQYTVEGVTPLSTYAVSRTVIVKAVD